MVVLAQFRAVEGPWKTVWSVGPPGDFLYFLIEANLESGSSIEFVLTLPQQITLAGDVHIRCYARVLRVDPQEGRNGVAAQIERYEFLPALA